MDGPPPPMRGEAELLDAGEALLQVRERATRVAEAEVVETDVDRRADLHVRVLDAAADVHALAVGLVCSVEIPELLIQPADRVHDAALIEDVVPLAGLGACVVDDAEAGAVLAEPDVGQRGEGGRVQLE